jgi:2-amino-4-hydroxy-6-hydroxymethyldihydropteridine diphosphokinase
VEVPDHQGNYLNMVVEVEYEGEAMDLLDRCQEAENALGRGRPFEHAARTIDIDILLIPGLEVKDGRLTVPHPRLEDRAFVVHPLAEIAPGLILPSGRTADQVKKALGNDEIVSIREYSYG